MDEGRGDDGGAACLLQEGVAVAVTSVIYFGDGWDEPLTGFC